MHPLLKRFSGQRELLVRTLVSISVRIVGAFSVFILSVFVARYLGAEESGYYFLAFSIVTFTAAVSRFGFDNTLVRFIGAALPDNEWSNIQSVFSRALIIATCISTITAFLLYIGSGFIAEVVFDKPALEPILKAIVPSVVGLSVLTLLATALQGLHKVVPSVFIVNILLNICVLLGVWFFDLRQAVPVAVALSIGSGVTVLVGFLLWFKYTKRGSGYSDVSWNELLASCMPLWIVVLMAQLMQWSGQFIAGAWAPADQVAQLAVAQRTAMLTSFILMAVNLVVAPRFAAIYKQGRLNDLEQLALISVKLMALFAVPIAGIMLLFPSLFMGLFGKGFSDGNHLLQILVVGQFVNVLTGSVSFLLSMSGHERDLRNALLVSGPLAVFGAWFLVPIWGVTGCAIATAFAVATENLLAVWWVKKRLGINMLAVWRL